MVFAPLGNLLSRLGDGQASPSESVRDFSPPFREEYPSDSASVYSRLKLWWRQNVLGFSEESQEAPSALLTLIPLNGELGCPPARLLVAGHWLCSPGKPCKQVLQGLA